MEDIDEAYIKGMNEAYIKNPYISIKTKDKQKIISLIYDIGDCVNHHISQYKK